MVAFVCLVRFNQLILLRKQNHSAISNHANKKKINSQKHNKQTNNFSPFAHFAHSILFINRETVSSVS